MKLTVAAFDFDGTISYHDTLLHFLFFSQGIPMTLLKLFRLSPYFFLYLIGKISRQSIKEQVLKAFFAGELIETLKEKGKQFAQKKLAAHLRPQAMERLRWHQQQGHVCILISASLDIYLSPWAEQEKFQYLISSQLNTDQEGKVSGRLEGLNCWGAEKVRRLEKLLGPKSEYELYAYGDSCGDKELLELADYPFFRTMGEGR